MSLNHVCITKTTQLYVTHDMSYRIELLSIPYDMTKSYVTESQRVYIAALITHFVFIGHRMQYTKTSVGIP